jgi:hypothetical protein
MDNAQKHNICMKNLIVFLVTSIIINKKNLGEHNFLLLLGASIFWLHQNPIAVSMALSIVIHCGWNVNTSKVE